MGVEDLEEKAKGLFSFGHPGVSSAPDRPASAKAPERTDINGTSQDQTLSPELQLDALKLSLVAAPPAAKAAFAHFAASLQALDAARAALHHGTSGIHNGSPSRRQMGVT